MANYSVKGYAKVYASPEDLDLWSAGITERPLPGSMVGPTFACLIGKQFHNFRFGDRLVSPMLCGRRWRFRDRKVRREGQVEGRAHE